MESETMMTGNPFPSNAWLTYAEATARWGKPTSPKQVEYILATPTVLAADPAVVALVADAEARGMERAADALWTQKNEDDWGYWGGDESDAAKRGVRREIQNTLRAEAATIRKGKTP